MNNNIVELNQKELSAVSGVGYDYESWGTTFENAFGKAAMGAYMVADAMTNGYISGTTNCDETCKRAKESFFMSMSKSEGHLAGVVLCGVVNAATYLFSCVKNTIFAC